MSALEPRLQDPAVLPGEDPDEDRSLRPRRLEDFIGQESVREQLAVSITAAIKRGEVLDHVLLAGPPGLGKTSLAQIIAAEMDAPFTQTAGPALERKGDVASYLAALEPGSVLFVDEIHRLPRALEETFYPAMEDGILPMTVGQGAGARIVTLPLPSFTLIGATTRSGLLTSPLRDRFGIQHRLEHYGAEDLARIVRRSAGLLGVDEQGLDRLDREILRAICEKFGGGPVGLSTLAVAVGEEQDTIEDVYEPYLLQCGLIERTQRGRAATRRAYDHLGLTHLVPPARSGPTQPTLL
jgi:Holliday junction DNA helicase RuvB